jgi:hypothetical protein
MMSDQREAYQPDMPPAAALGTALTSPAAAAFREWIERAGKGHSPRTVEVGLYARVLRGMGALPTRAPRRAYRSASRPTCAISGPGNGGGHSAPAAGPVALPGRASQIPDPSKTEAVVVACARSYT